MGSHSVTCCPTQVNTPYFNPSLTGCYSIYLPRLAPCLVLTCAILEIRRVRLKIATFLDPLSIETLCVVAVPDLRHSDDRRRPETPLPAESGGTHLWSTPAVPRHRLYLPHCAEPRRRRQTQLVWIQLVTFSWPWVLYGSQQSHCFDIVWLWRWWRIISACYSFFIKSNLDNSFTSVCSCAASVDTARDLGWPWVLYRSHLSYCFAVVWLWRRIISARYSFFVESWRFVFQIRNSSHIDTHLVLLLLFPVGATTLRKARAASFQIRLAWNLVVMFFK